MADQVIVTLSLKVDVSTLASWQPDRVQALFNGIGEVVAVSGGAGIGEPGAGGLETIALQSTEGDDG